MKKIIATVVLAASGTVALACEVCKKQQPKALQGITHGAGPQSDWDYVIIGAVTAIVLVTFFYSVKWLIRPGEGDQHHIKNSILNFD